MRITYLLLVGVLFLRTLQPVMVKEVAVRTNGVSWFLVPLEPVLWGVLAVLAIQTWLWQLTLVRLPLGMAYLWLSMVFPLLLVASHFLYDEPVTSMNLLGTVLIITGVIIIGLTGRKYG